ncbi:hypothetical protein [Telmatospirillum siberiense]|uniref:Glycosyl transferase n=1 Tax=Telmatospirillum siberiense TaxID=382514 RepID=A0A2N3PPG8_9PROT|nr:hypothetical protein [Telmatospirillum siberiense]PKU22276.1 hypothetical protein CWS72_22695 [Telmatospirillum siberiense]
MSNFPAHPHIVVATPCFGGNVSSLYTNSLLGLQRACMQLQIDVSFRLLGGDALITRARNIAVQQFLATPSATHLLFIDADIGFSADQALALLAANKDVAGGIYPLKRIDWDRVTQQALAGVADLPSSAFNYVVDLLDPTDVPPADDFFRVRYIGTGFMMIKREVFVRMAEHYPDIRFNTIHVGANADIAHADAHAFFDCIIDRDSGTYLSEDYTFCKRWLDMGGDIWAHAKSRLSHVGPATYDGDLSAMLRTLGASGKKG